VNHSVAPIGVFDFGVGGLSVLRELLRLLPDERYLYLGDPARIPYDSKSSETVQLFARQCARFLADQWVKLIVVASSWRDVRFCLTDIPPTFVPIAERFLGFPVNRVERVEIDHLGA